MRGSGKTGIIPAYARNTRSGTHRGKATQDHPRLRGEHRPCSPCRPFRAGSSPLTRGTRQPNAPRDRLVGIIPAYAGNTRRSATSCSPRTGSSPLTRGTRIRGLCAEASGGIIPAYAGNTPSYLSSRRLSRDHPRLRGEHSNPSVPYTNGQGSSPLTRGTPSFPLPPTWRRGIIPAYAGNTSSISC